jgi:ABC-type lipopolysaccharide export system ATPase subunit
MGQKIHPYGYRLGVITDHNARQTLELVDRAYLIYEGKVLREGQNGHGLDRRYR